MSKVVKLLLVLVQQPQQSFLPFFLILDIFLISFFVDIYFFFNFFFWFHRCCKQIFISTLRCWQRTTHSPTELTGLNSTTIAFSIVLDNGNMQQTKNWKYMFVIRCPCCWGWLAVATSRCWWRWQRCCCLIMLPVQIVRLLFVSTRTKNFFPFTSSVLSVCIFFCSD